MFIRLTILFVSIAGLGFAQSKKEVKKYDILAVTETITEVVDGKEVRDDIVKDGTPEEIIAHIHEAIAEVDGKGLMIGPGCVVAQDCSDENLRAVRKAVELG